MTKEQFQTYVKENFFNGFSISRDRTLDSWLLSLEDWAKETFNKECDKQSKEEKAKEEKAKGLNLDCIEDRDFPTTPFFRYLRSLGWIYNVSAEDLDKTKNIRELAIALKIEIKFAPAYDAGGNKLPNSILAIFAPNKELASKISYYTINQKDAMEKFGRTF